MKKEKRKSMTKRREKEGGDKKRRKIWRTKRKRKS
jgi:hypothetical protein